MNDFGRTGIFIGVAVALGAVAWVTRPTVPELEQFDDAGEAFYADFTDPLTAASLEVVAYNEESGSATPFKVEFKDGTWTIPSHYDYPADGEDRLANTAAAIIDLRKDKIQSDRAQDHEALGVIDPLDDATGTLLGRGQRVTLLDASGSVLADFVIGKPVPALDGYRYVRLPGKKRTYAVKMNVDASTRFADWIDTNLLELTSAEINRIGISDYSINETTGSVDLTADIALERGDDATWSMIDVPENKELDTSKVTAMATALGKITITGVRPKPAALTVDLRSAAGLTVDMPTRLSLQSKGFFISRDGRLLSNEGEISIGTGEGIRYTLRFGEVLFGEGPRVSAGTDEDAATQDGEDGAEAVENRYLFVTANYDESLLPPRPALPTPPAPSATDDPESESETETASEPETKPEIDEGAMVLYQIELDNWEHAAEEARNLAKGRNDRFAAWYYVISNDDFQTIRPGIADLLTAKTAE